MMGETRGGGVGLLVYTFHQKGGSREGESNSPFNIVLICKPNGEFLDYSAKILILKSMLVFVGKAFIVMIQMKTKTFFIITTKSVYITKKYFSIDNFYIQ